MTVNASAPCCRRQRAAAGRHRTAKPAGRLTTGTGSGIEYPIKINPVRYPVKFNWIDLNWIFYRTILIDYTRRPPRPRTRAPRRACAGRSWDTHGARIHGRGPGTRAGPATDAGPMTCGPLAHVSRLPAFLLLSRYSILRIARAGVTDEYPETSLVTFPGPDLLHHATFRPVSTTPRSSTKRAAKHTANSSYQEPTMEPTCPQDEPFHL